MIETATYAGAFLAWITGGSLAGLALADFLEWLWRRRD